MLAERLDEGVVPHEIGVFVRSENELERSEAAVGFEEVYHTERHLLYVACTRARDQLLVTSGGPASEFLEDMLG